MEVFDIYFASIMAMTIHPGFNRDNCEALTIEEAANLADLMILEREKRCLSSQPE